MGRDDARPRACAEYGRPLHGTPCGRPPERSADTRDGPGNPPQRRSPAPPCPRTVRGNASRQAPHWPNPWGERISAGRDRHHARDHPRAIRTDALRRVAERDIDTPDRPPASGLPSASETGLFRLRFQDPGHLVRPDGRCQPTGAAGLEDQGTGASVSGSAGAPVRQQPSHRDRGVEHGRLQFRPGWLRPGATSPRCDASDIDCSISRTFSATRGSLPGSGIAGAPCRPSTARQARRMLGRHGFVGRRVWCPIPESARYRAKQPVGSRDQRARVPGPHRRERSPDGT